ncbi:unnamed protein product [Diamesa tonsa]
MENPNSKKVVCYWGNWAYYRPFDGKYTISHIDPTICTHIVYSFMVFDHRGDLKHLDEELDKGMDGFHIDCFLKLKSKNPNIKLMVSFGGAKVSTDLFSIMAANSDSRTKFAENVAKFCEKYGLDGMDLDWEYPCQGHDSASDKINFTLLLRELKEKLGEKILSIAAAAYPSKAAESYDIAEVSKIVDFVNLMTFDPQRKEKVEPLLTTDNQLSISDCVDYWVREGCQKDKIVLGIPTYGRSYTSRNYKTDGVVCVESAEHGKAGPSTKNAGFLECNEIFENKRENGADCSQYVLEGDHWVGYNSVTSVTKKCEYIKKEELGGAMFWTLETEDFRDRSGYQMFPLMKAANTTFFDKQ